MTKHAAAVEREIPLHGGTTNRGLVTRKGNTVRRPMRATSAATHALLRHLEDAGFDGAPRFLRVDQRGREVCSYIDGSAAAAPLPAWALTDDALVSVAALLRRYHDAVASFDHTAYRWSVAAPAAFGHQLISHNDPAPDNVIFRDGKAVAIVDFDLASPGSRLWDVACTARLWSPLCDERDIHDARAGRSFARLQLFVDAYGLASADRAALGEAVLAAHEWCYDRITDAVKRGHQVFVPYWDSGGRARAERSHAWIARHRRQLTDLVTSAN
ncbi:MAG TPA: phosphotransferase [Dermatophilaceae bacterium]|nr:phosphotransferase [Dermatophilaceae bacterium]